MTLTEVKRLIFDKIVQFLGDIAPNQQGGFGNARVSNASVRTATATPDLIDPSDFLVLVNAGAATVNLPPCTDGGRWLLIINVGTSTAVTPAGADTIDGGGAVTLSRVGEFILLMSDTVSDWKTLGHAVAHGLSVAGPASSVNGHIAVWSGTTGALLKDSVNAFYTDDAVTVSLVTDSALKLTLRGDKDVKLQSVTEDAEVAAPTGKIVKLTVNGVTILSVTGSIVDAGTHKISNVVDPAAAQDAATKNYVDTADAGKVSTTLTSGNILVGNGSNVATSVAMSGDGRIGNTGAFDSQLTTETGITAAGTVQGDATALTKKVNEVTTTAAATGVRLPTAVAGYVVYVFNRGANTLNIYPASGAQINALGANVADTAATLTHKQYVAVSSTQWYSVP